MPPKGRQPVWPSIGKDGRLLWPQGDDELAVRIYTIRAIDPGRQQMQIDFVQHQKDEAQMPGADFARDARPGDIAALMGPGGSGVPKAAYILLLGDESALPAIARIAAEIPEDTRLCAFIEVDDEAEQQKLSSAAPIEVHWLHRQGREAGKSGLLVEALTSIGNGIRDTTYVWAGCERDEAQEIRSILKSRGHNRHLMSVSAYWKRAGESDLEP
jgi:NADPH-dependent ferric siderophore reductase